MNRKIYIFAVALALTAGITAGCGDIEENPQNGIEITIPEITTEQVIITDEVTEPEETTAAETTVKKPAVTTRKPATTKKPVTTKKPAVTTKSTVITVVPATTTTPAPTTTISYKIYRDSTAQIIAETVNKWSVNNRIFYTLEGKLDSLPGEYWGKDDEMPFLEIDYNISGPELPKNLRGYWYVKMRDDDHALVDYVIWSHEKFTDVDEREAESDEYRGYYKIEYDW